MSPFARELFRRIALGLPLVGLSAGGAILATVTACTCSCPGSPPPERHAISDGERAAITLADGGVDPALCRELCGILDERAFRGDGGADADAGPLRLTSRGSAYASCALITSAPTSMIECRERGSDCIGGRAPAGLRSIEALPVSLGGSFARSSWFEAASVFAFEDLARELELHHAPRALSRRARLAAADERGHAQLFARLAAREGVEVPAVERAEMRARSLEELARDNATEGLGREAFAALVAQHQAVHAQDVDLASVSAAIARDESRHALLSAEVHTFAVARLGGGAAIHLGELTRSMLASLAKGDEPADPRLGLPDAATRAHFAAALS